ncbi:MAG: HupE/UreJ family protein [Acidobacteriota bacterium]|nr:HupE/UreJ family protein [Acidobacteriota bacterium]
MDLRPVNALARTAILAMAWLMASQATRAHELELTEVHVSFSNDGRFTIDVMNDPGWLLMRVEPFSGLGLSGRLDPPARDRRLTEMEATFAEWVHLYFDGTRADVKVAYRSPSAEGPAAADGTSLGVMRLVGQVPEGASTFSFAYGLIMDPYPLLIRDRGDDVITYWNVGEFETEPFRLGDLTPPTRLQVIRTYLQLGFTHIVPKGLDHILFVIGIFMLGTRLTPILAQVTTFTIAHTFTLGLSMFGLVSLPANIVEPLIALSIVYVAVENLVTSDLKPWRLSLVFGFGLLHGLGFAGVLSELGVPRDEFVPALMSFNLGVEGGQLAVIAALFVALGWARHTRWYRRVAVVPISLGVATIGVYWTVTRVVSG